MLRPIGGSNFPFFKFSGQIPMKIGKLANLTPPLKKRRVLSVFWLPVLFSSRRIFFFSFFLEKNLFFFQISRDDFYFCSRLFFYPPLSNFVFQNFIFLWTASRIFFRSLNFQISIFEMCWKILATWIYKIQIWNHKLNSWKQRGDEERWTCLKNSKRKKICTHTWLNIVSIDLSISTFVF